MKRLSILLSALIMLMSLTACSNNDSSVKDNSVADSTTDGTTTVPTTTGPVIEERQEYTVESGHPVILADGPTEAMMERAILNQGNTDRLKAVINKAKESGEITVAYIGGSITQGSSPSNFNNAYVNQTTAWLESTLGVTVNHINAGIGATDSYIGVHRADADVIEKNPDLVFVEFAVNDVSVEKNTASYDSLLYKLLNAPSQPAVISLIMTQENGTSLTAVHETVAKHYDIPIISYRDVVYPEVVAGNLMWAVISPDNIHPNDAGHTLLSQLIQKYLTDVIADAEGFGTAKPDTQYTAFAGNIYADATMGNRDSDRITVVSEGGFTEAPSFQCFKNGWGTKTAGSVITFEIEAKNIGIVYKKFTSGLSTMAKISIDGEEIDILDGDFINGWGDYAESQILLSSDETKVHTVEVKLLGDDSEFQILSWLIS